MLKGGVKKADVAAASPTRDVVSSPARVVEPRSVTPFDRDVWFTYGDGDGYQEWISREGKEKSAIKWGQLKLLANEIQFFTLYWNPKDVPKPLCLYVGSSPGHHILKLADLFPAFEFHLFDPRNDQFDPGLRKHPRVKIFGTIFEDHHAEKYRAEGHRMMFVCDMRSGSIILDKTDEANRVTERLVWQDMQLQQGWVKVMQPYQTMLKFRLPYTYDFVRAEGLHRSYLDGILFRQPWAPHTSTEARLIPHKNLAMRDYDINAYEQACFYHNSVIREQFRFTSPVSPIGGLAPDMGLTEDYDSVCFVEILREYLLRMGREGTREEVRALAFDVIKSCNTRSAHTLATIRSSGTRGTDIPDDET